MVGCMRCFYIGILIFSLCKRSITHNLKYTLFSWERRQCGGSLSIHMWKMGKWKKAVFYLTQEKKNFVGKFNKIRRIKGTRKWWEYYLQAFYTSFLLYNPPARIEKRNSRVEWMDYNVFQSSFSFLSAATSATWDAE